MESHSELAKLLTEKELRDALLLIFANKQVRREQMFVIIMFVLNIIIINADMSLKK